VKSIFGKTIKNEDIVIDEDSKYYVNCTLVNCKIVYPGGKSPFVNCKIQDCQITFVGEAQETLQFMQSMGMIAPPVPPAIAGAPDTGTLH
jgi:hypothetical protein